MGTVQELNRLLEYLKTAGLFEANVMLGHIRDGLSPRQALLAVETPFLLLPVASYNPAHYPLGEETRYVAGQQTEEPAFTHSRVTDPSRSYGVDPSGVP